MKSYKIAASRRWHWHRSDTAGVEALQRWPNAKALSASPSTIFDWGGEYYKKHGRMMPENGRDLSGSTTPSCSAPRPPESRPHHAVGAAARVWPAVRPVRQCTGRRGSCPASPRPLRHVNGGELRLGDRRENSEGEYSGSAAACIRLAVKRHRRLECSPVPGRTHHAFAFRLAQSRPRKLLTVVTKSNAQRHAMVMWDEIAVGSGARIPRLKWDKMLVRRMTMRMVTKPQSLDTSSPPTCTPTFCRTLPRRSQVRSHTRRPQPQSGAGLPSMFEPIHGSAFDIMGKHRQPGRHVLSAVMMRNHLGEPTPRAA